MQINREKIIIASLAFLIVGVLLFSRSGWIMLTARPVPSAVIQYPTPKPINDEEFRRMLPIPVSMEAWLERLNSKKIPETRVAEWKIYKNRDYGFELQYPSTWEITEGEGTGPLENGKYMGISFEGNVLLGISEIPLKKYIKLSPVRNQYFLVKGLNPDVIINGIKIIIDSGYSDRGNAAYIPMLFEHNGITYSFGMKQPIREDEIIEYMIKSFHFVQ